MPEIRYNPEIKQVLDEMLLDLPGVTPGKMFGFPGYYINGKLLACLYEDTVSLKLPAETVQATIDGQTYTVFEPFGRKMRAWLQIHRANPEDYRQEEELLKQAAEFVAALPAK